MMRIVLISIFLISMNLCSISAQEKNTANQLFSKIPNEIYLGAVMSKKSINTEKHEIIEFKTDLKLNLFSSGLKYEFPAINPSRVNMDKVIHDELKKSGAPNGSGGISSFITARINTLDNINLNFGQTMDLAKWFGLDKKNLNTKTTLAVYFEVPLFDLNLETGSESFYNYGEEIKKLNNSDLFFVWGITWGRKAVIIFQSDFEDKKLIPVINKLIAETALNDEEKIILETASISYNIFTQTPLKLDDTNPIKSVLEYLEAAVTVDNYGSVIYFFGNNPADGSNFINSF